MDIKFWGIFLLAIILGIVFPNQLALLKNYVSYIIMAVLFVAFLKIDLSEIPPHLKKLNVIVYVLIVYMLVIPAIFYFLSLPLSKDLAVALFLLALLPVGTAAPAINDIVGGDGSFAIILTITSTFLSMITIPLMFLIFFNTRVNLDYVGMATTLIELVSVPLILSEILKRADKKIARGISAHSTWGILILMLSIVAITIAVQSNHISGNLAEIGYYLIILMVAFLLFQIISYYLAFWLKKEERITVSASKVFNNCALGIVLALAYFDAKVALILVLAEIPWNIMLAAFNATRVYLK